MFGKRPRQLRPGAVGGQTIDCVEKCGARGLSAEFVVVEGGPQFEQDRALAAINSRARTAS
jgi:hypothetical protein